MGFFYSIKHIPQWRNFSKTGLFSFIVNANAYPDGIRLSTLFSERYDIVDNNCVLFSHSANIEMFNLPTADVFDVLCRLAHPQATEENAYPEQIFDYGITTPNVS
ncbi:hypothetical protein BTJ39_06985 [Izhakiella australiensis]|uniref:Uncharacterized protein n=1 Tax=Izhakiella australiensis TaxID=1926881 RepID=A0A1S8YPM8_9GAMM|nr:Imm42 family immunity protein [Izhakiella australiensis]OON40812.1 hypothetical protein BTJ39_06985 [Izhakiella australiensis]